MAQANPRDLDYSKGNVIAFKNVDKQKGDKRPAYKGRLNLPGQRNERGFSVWAFTSEKGQVMLSGKVNLDAQTQTEEMAGKAMDPDAAIRIAQNGGKDFTVDPNQIVLFENTQRDGEDPERPRPNYWGYFNPGKGERLMKVALWQGTDRNGNAFLKGNLQPDEPKREKTGEREDDDPQPKAKTKGRARSKEAEMAR
jgi:hypothetical protein